MSKNKTIRNSKLLRVFASLDKKEVRLLGKWLKSPLHNSSVESNGLFMLLEKDYPDFEKISKEEMLDCLAAQKTVRPTEAQLRKAMTKLLKQINDFIIWLRLKEEQPLCNRWLADAYMERKLYDLIPGIQNTAKKELEAADFRNHEYSQQLFLLRETNFFMDIIQRNRSLNDNLQPLIDAFRQYAIGKLLSYYASAKEREKILQVSYDYPLMESILVHLKKNEGDRQVPIIMAYSSILSLVMGETGVYLPFKGFLLKHSDYFDSTENRQFLNFMLNFCNQRIKEGERNYMEEKHELYVLGIEKQLWVSGTYFSPIQFLHVVKNALKLQKKDWLKAFVGEYSKQLPPGKKVDIVEFTRALIAFEERDFDQAQVHLRCLRMDDFLLELDIKVFYAKLKFEQENLDDTVEDAINSIRFAILTTRNKKLSKRLREAYNNFVKYAFKIWRRRLKIAAKKSLNPRDLEKLQQEIQGAAPIVERDWLLAKSQEL